MTVDIDIADLTNAAAWGALSAQSFLLEQLWARLFLVNDPDPIGSCRGTLRAFLDAPSPIPAGGDKWVEAVRIATEERLKAFFAAVEKRIVYELGQDEARN